MVPRPGFLGPDKPSHGCPTRTRPHSHGRVSTGSVGGTTRGPVWGVHYQTHRKAGPSHVGPPHLPTHPPTRLREFHSTSRASGSWCTKMHPSLRRVCERTSQFVGLAQSRLSKRPRGTRFDRPGRRLVFKPQGPGMGVNGHNARRPCRGPPHLIEPHELSARFFQRFRALLTGKL